MPMSHRDEYDVIILGAGLAGLTLALQLRKRRPDLRIALLEKRAGEAPEAAHKVGESSVELGAHYFGHVLGLRDMLRRDQLPKLGLRFYFSYQGNRDIARRVELAPFGFFTLPSYQLDRGRFENRLLDEVKSRGVVVHQGWRVRDVRLEEDLHRVEARAPDGITELRGRWVVDACGRSHLLKRRLGLLQEADHEVNAAWFRVDDIIDIDRWSDDPRWRISERWRALATNHLCGRGYWVWLIPLASGSTSVGIVADPRFHALHEFNSQERALDWLDRHEPQCAAQLRPRAHRIQDFLALKRYSHRADRVFSHERWALTGDAGMFVDPLYSPGSDFIAMSNCFITELIVRETSGAGVDGLSAAYDRIYRSLFDGFLNIYRDQYCLLGNPQVMCAKVIWDFAVYWGGICPLFFHELLWDPAFMLSVQEGLQGIQSLGERMKRVFLDWDERSCPEYHDHFVDYQNIEFLQLFHSRLSRRQEAAVVREQMFENVAFLGRLADEIERKADPKADLPEDPLGAPIRRELEKVWCDRASHGSVSGAVAWHLKRTAAPRPTDPHPDR